MLKQMFQLYRRFSDWLKSVFSPIWYILNLVLILSFTLSCLVGLLSDCAHLFCLLSSSFLTESCLDRDRDQFPWLCLCFFNHFTFLTFSLFVTPLFLCLSYRYRCVAVGFPPSVWTTMLQITIPQGLTCLCSAAMDKEGIRSLLFVLL